MKLQLYVPKIKVIWDVTMCFCTCIISKFSINTEYNVEWSGDKDWLEIVFKEAIIGLCNLLFRYWTGTSKWNHENAYRGVDVPIEFSTGHLLCRKESEHSLTLQCPINWYTWVLENNYSNY
jgi:hypothetical protein